MSEMHFSLGRELLKTLVAQKKRRNYLSARVASGIATDKEVEELFDINLMISAFGERVIDLASLLEESKSAGHTERQRTIH